MGESKRCEYCGETDAVVWVSFDETADELIRPIDETLPDPSAGGLAVCRSCAARAGIEVDASGESRDQAARGAT